MPLDDATRAGLEAEVMATMAAYHDGFIDGTRDDLQALVHLPVIYVDETDVRVCDRYPFDPVKLRTLTEFSYSDTETSITHLEPTRAHLTIEGTRHREDGSVLESIQSFYILQNRGQGWKVAMFSGIRGAL